MQPSSDAPPLRWQTTEQTQLYQTALTPDLVAWRLEAQKQVRTPTRETILEPVVAEGIAHRDDLREWAQHGQGIPKARAKWAWLTPAALEYVRQHYFGTDEMRPVWDLVGQQQPWTLVREGHGAWPGRLCVIDYSRHEVRDALTNRLLPKAIELNEIYLNWYERDMDLQGFRTHLMGRTDIRWERPRFSDALQPGQVPEPSRNPWDTDDEGPDDRGRHLRGTWMPSDEAWALVQEGLALLASGPGRSEEGQPSSYDRDRIVRLLDVFGADQFLRPDLRGDHALATERRHPLTPLSAEAYAQLLRIREELRQLPVPRTPMTLPPLEPLTSPRASAPPQAAKRGRRR